MSEPNVSSPLGDEPNESDAIQFDQAEYTTSVPTGPTCGVCQRPIADAYYEINGKVVCTGCRQAIEQSFRGGSRVGRALKATIYGSVAALIGAVLYYIFVRVTDYNVGLVAIVLGLLVGGAVKKGSGNRGGRFYQLLALFLTYSAIVGMHIPMIITGFSEAIAKDTPATTVAPKAKKPALANLAHPQNDGNAKKSPNYTGADIPDDPFANNPGAPPKSVAQPIPAVVPPDAEAEPKITPLAIAIVIAVVLAFSYASPVLVSINAPISGLIYCFALWEAWKMNRRVQLVFNGPYQVSATATHNLESEVEDEPG